MKLHQHFEFGPASQDPFSFCQIQLALDTVQGLGFEICCLCAVNYDAAITDNFFYIIFSIYQGLVEEVLHCNS
jgi:hypothetical protein